MRLLALKSNEELLQYFDQLERETKALKREALRICWHMRGSISYDEAMQLSFPEREEIGKLISDNLETTKKTGLPYF
jgi:hypothetical protein